MEEPVLLYTLFLTLFLKHVILENKQAKILLRELQNYDGIGLIFMKREIDKILLQWKTSTSRMPLLIRGARQVGKSYAITSFGTKNFESLVEVNFEIESKAKDCFESLDPQAILQSLEVI